MEGQLKAGWRSKAAVVLAVAGVLALGGMTGLTARAAQPGYGNIDGAKKGSIIIHKHEHQSGTSEIAKPDGSVNLTSPGINGVTFTICRITDLDLTVSAGWDQLAKLNAPRQVEDGATSADFPDKDDPGTTTPHGLTSVMSVTTAGTDGSGNPQGVATASSLPVGAYLVVETGRPSGVIDSAPPYIVTIPFPDKGVGASNGWLYDVETYPKNSVATITKGVNPQQGLGLGSTATYMVTATVPRLAGDAAFQSYEIVDEADARYVSDPDVKAVKVEGAALTKDRDYTVTVSGSKVTMSLTSAYLAGLKAHADKQVVVTFSAKVIKVPADGDIQDKATLSVRDDKAHSVTDPVVTADQYWGDARIFKVDGGDSAKAAGLAGARFKV